MIKMPNKDYKKLYFDLKEQFDRYVKHKRSHDRQYKECRELIKEYQNPYPKDIFKWDNKEKLNFNRGRFNEFIYNVVENTKKDIIRLIEEETKYGKP